MNRWATRAVVIGLITVLGAIVAAPSASAVPIDPRGIDGVDPAWALANGHTSPIFSLQKSAWYTTNMWTTEREPKAASQTNPVVPGFHELSSVYWTGAQWSLVIRTYFPANKAAANERYYRDARVTRFCSESRSGNSSVGTIAISTSGFYSNRDDGPNPSGVTLGFGTCPANQPWLTAVRVETTGDSVPYNTTINPITLWWFSGPARAGGVPPKPDPAFCVFQYIRDVDNFCPELEPDGLPGGEDTKPYIDAASFEVVCKDAPEAEWLSFGWLGPWVGHYAKCLFNPTAGLNLKPVEARFAGTFVKDVIDVGGGLGDLTMPQTCGVLLSTQPSVLMGEAITVNTCEGFWNQLGGMRTLLGVAAAIAAAVFSSNLLVGAIGLKYFGRE